jgi:hypothetical protein
MWPIPFAICLATGAQRPIIGVGFTLITYFTKLHHTVTTARWVDTGTPSAGKTFWAINCASALKCFDALNQGLNVKTGAECHA